MDCGRVVFLSRAQMVHAVLVETYDPTDTVVISINDTDDDAGYMHCVLDKYECIIEIFADVDGGFDSINDDQARRIVSFIDSNKDKRIVVHCWAGVSRSGAIAKFINEHLGINDASLSAYGLYNHWVFNALKAAVGESLIAYYEHLEAQDRLDPKE